MKLTPLLDEKELLCRLKKGDESAFNSLYAHYGVTLYGNILTMVRDPEVADDLHQDLFSKIWHKREDIDLDKSFRSFLYTCAKYQVYDYLKRVEIEKHAASYFSFKNSEFFSHVEEEIVFKETDALYQSIIKKLPAQCQKVYILVRREGLSYEEAATELGISTLTVRNHLAKATRIIKEQMGPHVIPILVAGFGYLN